jgi:hypothetical protein
MVTAVALAALVTGAEAVELCFHSGSDPDTGIQFRLEVLTIGAASASVAGGARFGFPGVFFRPVFGSAYARPNGQARLSLAAPAGSLSVLFDLLLDPPVYTSGTGTLETVDPPGSASLTLSPLAVCPTLD